MTKKFKVEDDQKNSKWRTKNHNGRHLTKIKIEDNQKNQNETNKVDQYNLIKNNQFGCGTAPGNLV